MNLFHTANSLWTCTQRTYESYRVKVEIGFNVYDQWQPRFHNMSQKKKIKYKLKYVTFSCYSLLIVWVSLVCVITLSNIRCSYGNYIWDLLNNCLSLPIFLFTITFFHSTENEQKIIYLIFSRFSFHSCDRQI